jgi:hypothetical protein
VVNPPGVVRVGFDPFAMPLRNDRYLRLPAEDPVAVKQSVRRATVDVAAGVRTFAAL